MSTGAAIERDRLRAKAQALFGAGDLHGALDGLKRLLEGHPADAELHNDLGAVLFGLGRIAESRECFLQALAHDPGCRSARENLEHLGHAVEKSIGPAANSRPGEMPEKIDYSQQWYAESYARESIEGVETPMDLLRVIHARPSRYRWRFMRWFDGLDVQGEVLEAGFNVGKTSYYLAEHFDQAQVDGIDFNPSLHRIAELLPLLHRNLRRFWISDVRAVDRPDGSYDHITCLDFIEHIPEDVYLPMIDEFSRLLRPNGRVYVYVGQTYRRPEHIHVIPDVKVIRDFMWRGFRVVRHQAEENFMAFRKAYDLATAQQLADDSLVR